MNTHSFFDLNRWPGLGRNFTALAVALTLLSSAPGLCARQASTSEEQKLIAVLESPASLRDKDSACERLKHIGTTACIPAVAKLLLDKQLSHSARYVLEAMSAPEAGQALVAALASTSGSTRVGIIDSISVRKEPAAVPELKKLIGDSDNASAVASAIALGQIGTREALAMLQDQLPVTTGQLHRAIVDSCLRAASVLAASTNLSEAKAIYKSLLSTEKDTRTRMAAFVGLVRASGDEGLAMAAKAIRGKDTAERAAALRLVPELKIRAADRVFARLLPEVGPVVQVSLLQGLGYRGATEAAPAMARLLTSPDASVRIAAASALGSAGEAAQVGALAAAAARAEGDEQQTEREALGNLNHGEVNEALIRLLEKSQPEVQAEAARALGTRGDHQAVPRLLQLAEHGSVSAQKAALKALPALATESDLAVIARLVSIAKTSEIRSAAVESLNGCVQSVKLRSGLVDPEPILDRIEHGSREVKIALLPICGAINGGQVRSALRHYLADQDPEVRDAAVSALCDSTDQQLLPDMAALACSGPGEATKLLAARACVRMTTQEDGVKLASGAKVKIYQTILKTAPSSAEKKMLLAGLGEIPDARAFALVEPLTQESDVAAEAQQAAVEIATVVSGPETASLKQTLQRIADSGATAELRKSAHQAIEEIETAADYITNWEVAGPFQRKGKNYSALFDVPFAPENPGKPVKWQPLPVRVGSGNPRVMDLLRVMQGEQRVAYARARVYSPEAQPARLELGSDDGIKVWLNGKPVLANNTARPLRIGSDKVDIGLKKGWNELLLKVTQNTQGWEFCARLVQPDGGHLSGIRVGDFAETARAAR